MPSSRKRPLAKKDSRKRKKARTGDSSHEKKRKYQEISNSKAAQPRRSKRLKTGNIRLSNVEQLSESRDNVDHAQPMTSLSKGARKLEVSHAVGAATSLATDSPRFSSKSREPTSQTKYPAELQRDFDADETVAVVHKLSMASLSFWSILLLQVKLLLWKNLKLHTRVTHWGIITTVIICLVGDINGAFESDVQTRIVASEIRALQPFHDEIELKIGTFAIISELNDTEASSAKLAYLEEALNRWFALSGDASVISNISSVAALEIELIKQQQRRTPYTKYELPFDADDIGAALCIHRWDDADLDYTIRLHSEWVRPYSRAFIPLQLHLNRLFIAYNVSNMSVGGLLGTTLRYQPIWAKEYERSELMGTQGESLPFRVLGCFMLPLAFMVKNIVAEKAARTKEGMRTMGMYLSAFWLSWFITYFVIFSVVASLMTLIHWATSMFHHTCIGLLFALYLLYGLTLIGLAAVITTFFDQAETAFQFSVCLYVFLQGTSYALHGQDKLSTLALSLLSSPTAMFVALNSIVELETIGRGYEFATAFDVDIRSSIQNGYCLGDALVALCLHTVLYFTSVWFLDQYVRSRYGQQLPMRQIASQLACCCSKLSRARATHLSIEADGEASIEIRNLCKTFPGNGAREKAVHAVNKLSLNIFKGEVTAMLGHNGAGKTTTINMLIGTGQPDTGTVRINGYSIGEEMDAIRQLIGVCPQHSLLWPTLTVYEHLYLCAAMKHAASAHIDSAIATLLHDVQLTNQRDCCSSTLSGGQCRALSVAMAFIGDPKVVFLDEPTSGMDPVSRGRMWDLIGRYKQDRCIVLTTHDMDEADAIADRIAIMSQGQLRICGTPLHLKSVCGVGYRIVFTLNGKGVSRRLGRLENLIGSVIADAVLSDTENVYAAAEQMQSAESLEVAFSTSIRDSAKFPLLFNLIDAHSASLRISNYAVSVTTMEEVFLKITDQSETDNQRSSDEFQISDETIDAMLKIPRPTLSASQRCCTQITTLLRKRLRVARRDVFDVTSGWTTTMFLMLSAAYVANASRAMLADALPPALDPATYQAPMVVPLIVSSTFTDTISALAPDILPLRVSEIESLRELNQWMMDEEWYRAPHHVNSVLAALHTNSSEGTVTLLYDPKATHLLPALVNQWSTAILRRVTSNDVAHITVRSDPIPSEAQRSNDKLNDVRQGVMRKGWLSSSIILSSSTILAKFASRIVHERESRVKHQQLITGLSVASYWIANLLFDLVIFMLPYLVAFVLLHLNIVGLLVLVAFGLSITAQSYLLSFLITDPESAQSYTNWFFQVSGMTVLGIGSSVTFGYQAESWWVNALLFACRLCPSYAFAECLAIAGASITADANDSGDEVDALQWDIIGRCLAFLLASTVGSLLLVGLMENLSLDDCDCWSWRTAYNSQRLRLHPKPNERLLPHLAAPEEEDADVAQERESIRSGSRRHSSGIEITGLRKVFKHRKPKQAPVVAVNNLWFAVGRSEIFGFLGSNGAGKTTAMHMLTKQLVPTGGNAHLRSGGARNDLLHSSSSRFFSESHIGYCSQSDRLCELLTGREHLEFYCRLRGFSWHDTNARVNILIAVLQLSQFCDGTVNKYSGGNRRKVCVGIALIGNPSIVILDEPSVGIDPMARRSMWNFIGRLTRSESQKRSVLLTTHSMEEAESLCDRIAIMDKGRLQCLGSAQHLKTKYGGGYALHIKLKNGFAAQSKANLKEQVLVTLRQDLQFELEARAHDVDVRLLIDHNVVLRFSIRLCADDAQQDNEPGTRRSIPVGKVFGFVESFKDECEILEYSVGQSTLEQVFSRVLGTDDAEQT